MNAPKRGDHVFNAGLSKGIQELSRLVNEVFAIENGRGPARLAELQKFLGELRAGVPAQAFQLVVSKPAPRAIGGDANSTSFGRCQEEMLDAFRQFLTALRGWLGANNPQVSQSQSRMLHTACLELRLAVGRWTDSASDPAAEALLRRESPGSAAAIDAGHRYLTKVREAMAAMIRSYTP